MAKNEVGCRYKDSCQVYSGRYDGCGIICPTFKTVCETIPADEFPEWTCPVYDDLTAIEHYKEAVRMCLMRFDLVKTTVKHSEEDKGLEVII